MQKKFMLMSECQFKKHSFASYSLKKQAVTYLEAGTSFNSPVQLP